MKPSEVMEPGRATRRGVRTPSRQALALVVLALGIGALGCGSKSGSGTTFTLDPLDGSVLPRARVGIAYLQTFTVVAGGSAPYVISALSLPPGLGVTTIDSRSAALQGTPTSSGSGILALQVSDGKSVQEADYFLTIELGAGTGPVVVSPLTLANGRVGVAYSQALSVSGGQLPYSWGIVGATPPGLQLGASNGATTTFFGTPVASGSYTLTITVTDGSNPPLVGSQSYTVTISP